jgi:3-oxoacyl-[acyl-carrier protein] reductase
LPATGHDAEILDGYDPYLDVVAENAGGIDIALNEIGILHVQDSAHPTTAYTRTNFLAAKAVARHLVKHGSGVILTLSTPEARMSGQGFLGNGVASPAIEAFSRILAGELGPDGTHAELHVSTILPVTLYARSSTARRRPHCLTARGLAAVPRSLARPATGPGA